MRLRSSTVKAWRTTAASASRHQPLPGELGPDPVADLRRLRRPAADVVERDRPDQPRVLAADEEERQRPALLARAPGPVDPVAEGPAGEMVGRPARLPFAQEALAPPAQHRPGGMVAHLRQAQRHPLGLDGGRRGAAEAEHADLRPPAASRAPRGRGRPRPARAARAPGSARAASPSPKARTRSSVTASILATISSIVGHPAPDAQHPRQPLRPRGRALEPHQHPGLELRPRPVELGHGQALRRPAQLVHGEPGQLADLLGPGAGIERDQPGVLVGAGLGEDGVAEPAPLAQLLEEPRRHAAAERGRVDLRRIGRILAHAGALEGHRHVHLLEIARLAPLAAGEARRQHRQRRPRARDARNAARPAPAAASGSTAPAAARIIRSGP